MALGYFEKMPAAPSVERDTSKTSQGVSNVDVGFIGLGAMGSAIATNLVNKSGHAITVWNRTAAKAESLIAAGAKLAKTPKEAGAGKSIVFSMLADDSALHAALSGDDGLLVGLPCASASPVKFSTVFPGTAAEGDCEPGRSVSPLFLMRSRTGSLKSDRIINFFEHLNRGNCDHPTDRNKFDNIDPSLAALVFSDK
jgi:hypothetical protein